MHCTGSLVAPRLVLSAAHCFAETSENYIQKENLQIVLGLSDLNMLNLSFVPKTIRKIQAVKVHPSYSWQEAYSDLVILVLNETVTFSSTIYPVCLPDKEVQDKNSLVKQSVTIVGFGPKDENSKTMRQISQKIRSFRYCDRRYKPENADIKYRPLLKKVLPKGFDDTLICGQNW